MSEPFIAQINLWANAFTVQYWAHCGGQLLAIGQNPALFSLIGTLYGGDGRVSMAVPNLQHRAAMGAGNGPGLSIRYEGDFGGLDQVSLTTNHLPIHNHGKPGGATGENSETNVPGNTVVSGLRKAPAATQQYVEGSSSNAADYEYMNDQAISLTGGNQPHQNMQPYLGLYFQMALTGIYPPRS